MVKTRGAKGLSTKSRVVAERDLLGVPEGTPGRIELVNGLTWIRYWVQFDNGIWLGSVDAKAVVAEDDWEDHLDRRAAAAARAAEEAAKPVQEGAPAAAPATAPADAAPADAGASKIPAALLARSQAAKAKKAAAATE